MAVLTDKPEVSRTDAALLVEELTEIYTIPTPFLLLRVGVKPKKVICID